MELHPSSFVETGTCSGPECSESGCVGPRNIRIQPSRSSDVPGSGPTSILTEWSIDLPYKNLLSFTKEIEKQWPNWIKNKKTSYQIH